VKPVPPILTNPNTPPQPAGWPDDDSQRFMMKTYGRLLTWPEYFARSERFAPDISSRARAHSRFKGTKHR
jgi:hypothetical protein